MLRALTLKNKIKFILLSGVWTVIFVNWVYGGYLWDKNQRMMADFVVPGAYAVDVN